MGARLQPAPGPKGSPSSSSMIEVARPALSPRRVCSCKRAPSLARPPARATRESTPQASLRGALPADGCRACRAGWPEVHRHAARPLTESRPAAVFGRAPGTFRCAGKRRRGPWAGGPDEGSGCCAHCASRGPVLASVARASANEADEVAFTSAVCAASLCAGNGPIYDHADPAVCGSMWQYVCIVAPQISMPLSTMAILRRTVSILELIASVCVSELHCSVSRTPNPDRMEC
jgi:hypothetical protein